MLTLYYYKNSGIPELQLWVCRCFLLWTILYFPDVPKRFRITHPTMIRMIAMTPTVFTFCPNTTAYMIVVATMPPAHQVA